MNARRCSAVVVALALVGAGQAAAAPARGQETVEVGAGPSLVLLHSGSAGRFGPSVLAVAAWKLPSRDPISVGLGGRYSFLPARQAHLSEGLHLAEIDLVIRRDAWVEGVSTMLQIGPARASTVRTLKCGFNHCERVDAAGGIGLAAGAGATFRLRGSAPGETISAQFVAQAWSARLIVFAPIYFGYSF